MSKKTVNDLFIKYAGKKKILDIELLKRETNYEKLISLSIIEALKKKTKQETGKFGYLKKSSKMVDSRLQQLVQFFPELKYSKKISKSFSLNRTKTAFPLKTAFIAAPLILLLLAGIGGITFYSSRVSKQPKSTDTTDTRETGAREEIQQEEKETVIFQDKEIYKETVDYESREVNTNEDKSVIIKTQNINDTGLKEGEFTSEIVSIDGRVYNKNIYIVKKGDTLWDIAERFLHNPFLWPDIHKDNPYIINPHLIEPAYKLTIYTEYKE